MFHQHSTCQFRCIEHHHETCPEVNNADIPMQLRYTTQKSEAVIAKFEEIPQERQPGQSGNSSWCSYLSSHGQSSLERLLYLFHCIYAECYTLVKTPHSEDDLPP